MQAENKGMEPVSLNPFHPHGHLILQGGFGDGFRNTILPSLARPLLFHADCHDAVTISRTANPP
jgi:hypothetical protein